MVRRRAYTIAAATLLVVSPFVYRTVKNDLAADDLLDTLAMPLPPDTELLKVSTDVAERSGRCRILAAKVLATEQNLEQIAAQAAAQTRAPGNDLWIAWSSPGRFNAAKWQAGQLQAQVVPPPEVERLLSQWMVLPQGVRRIVLYTTERADSWAEARCF